MFKLGALLSRVKATDVEAVRKQIENDLPGSYTLLDVREPSEYEAGHLPGAIHIPLSELADRFEELPHDIPLVAY